MAPKKPNRNPQGRPGEDQQFWTVNRIWLAWVGIIVVFVAMRWTIAAIPLERDEGEYAYIAQQAMHGAVPYHDAFDQKPPGVFAIYTVGMFIFGRSAEAIHFFMFLWTLGAMALLYRLVRRLCGTGAGLLAALVLGIITAEKGVLGSAANTEIFMLLPLVGSLLCLVPKDGRPGLLRIVGAGALAAAACWIKQVAATDAVFLSLWLVVAHFSAAERRGFGRLILEEGALILGAMLATAPVILYFYATGAMKDFIYCVFTYNFSYATTNIDVLDRGWEPFRDKFEMILAGDWLFWAALVAGLVWLAARGRRKLLLYFAGFLALSFVGVCFGGYFRPHYFVQILPAVAALAGVGLAWLLGRIAGAREWIPRWLGYAAVTAAVVAMPIYANRDILFAASPEAASVILYGPTPFVFSSELGKEIESATDPGDTVLVAGTEPQIAFFSRRKSATRYIFFNPLAAPTETPGLVDNQKQALEEIRRARPRCIVNLIGIYGGTIFTPQSNPLFLTELAQYIREEGYKPVDYWKALPEGVYSELPNRFVRFTPADLAGMEKRSGQKISTQNMTTVLFLPDKAN
jgi:4-amino-4-deoxy-L-arabinose transferase-like glycosyltransferase